MNLTKEYLNGTIKNFLKRGFPIPKWAAFSWYMLDHGFCVSLYRARNTNSKYVTVYGGHKRFKVRFSDHKPILYREKQGDCDFFVGITHYAITNSKMAVEATLKYFKE